MVAVAVEWSGATRRRAQRNGYRARRAVGVADPELVEGPKRRRFTAEHKLRVLREVEACASRGEIGALLRREGLYSSPLSEWRKQRDTGALMALGRPRGPKPPHLLEAEVARLRRRLERTEGELAKARRVIEVQETSLRCWASCSSPGARRGAPNDDRADRWGARTARRDQAGVPGVGCGASDDLPSSSSGRAPTETAADAGGQGALRRRALRGARRAALRALR
jgi:transposase-like protein